MSVVFALGAGCAPKQPEPAGGDPGTGGAPAPASTGGAPAPAAGGATAPSGTGGAGNGGSVAPPATGGAAAPGDAAPPPPAEGIEIVVAAGAHARSASIVSFKLEGMTGPALFGLRDGAGARLPLQLDATGKAVFVLPALAAGAEATFTLEKGGPAEVAVTAVKEADGVKLMVGAAQVARYQMQGKLPGGVGAAFLRGGYLHPILTPGGVIVTDDYPGDHRHHHGLWSAWAKTDFEGRTVDFWNMGGRSAKVDFGALEATWDGPVHGGLRARQDHSVLGGEAKVVMKETWDVTAYRTHAEAPPYFVFDLDSAQEATTASPVKLQQYIYGGFALRGAASWGGGGGAVFLTSEGKNRGNGDGTDARWCFIGGRVDGKMAGYAALVHPSNFRAPQPVRINPTDPFFSIAPVRDGGFDITMGKPYLSRYRIVVTDGAPDAALLERLYQDYATPPAVTVRRR